MNNATLTLPGGCLLTIPPGSTVRTQTQTTQRPAQVRSVTRAADSLIVKGTAAVFGTTTDIGQFQERVRQGAFKRSLKDRPDVVALHSHDSALVLGRTPNTLRLWEDTRGLQFELELPDSPLGRTIYQSVDRRDIKTMSFGFIVEDDDWSTNGDTLQRELIDVTLLEISSVAWAAYPTTSIVVPRATSPALARKLAQVAARARQIAALT